MATEIPAAQTWPTQASNRVLPCPGVLQPASQYSGLPPVPLQRNRRTNSHKPPLQWRGRPALVAGDWGTGAIVGVVGGSLPQGTGLDNAVPYGVPTAINPVLPDTGMAGPGNIESGGYIFETPVRETIGGVLG